MPVALKRGEDAIQRSSKTSLPEGNPSNELGCQVPEAIALKVVRTIQ